MSILNVVVYCLYLMYYLLLLGGEKYLLDKPTKHFVFVEGCHLQLAKMHFYALFKSYVEHVSSHAERSDVHDCSSGSCEKSSSCAFWSFLF